MVKKRRKRPRPNRTLFWGVILFIVGVFSLFWWLWSCLYKESPQFNFLLIEKDGQFLKLLNGETLYLHPQNNLKILKISTNICFNQGIRLFSDGFDVNALRHDKIPFSDLLSDRDIFQRYRFRIDIKRDNQNMGHVDLIIEPDVEDWLDKAQRTIKPSKRIAILERALEVIPDDTRIRVRLIEEYRSQKKWPKAARMIEARLKEKPEQEDLYNLLEVYEAMSKTDGMIDVLKRLLQKNPEDMDVRLRLATLLEKEKKLPEAIREYEYLLKPPGKEDRLPLYKALGYLYTVTGQPKRAIDMYLQAAELDREDVNLYYNLSSLYEMTGNQDKADLFLKKAVKLKSEDQESRLKLAENLIKKGKIREAEGYLSGILKKNPDNLEALLLMSKIAEKRGDKKALKKLYRKILSHDPKKETLIYNLGVLEYETGQLARSLPYFEKHLKLHPKDREVHSLLFDAYRRLKKDDRAYREAEILTGLKPQDIRTYRFMFEYLNSRKDYNRMTSVMKSGLKSHPKNLELRKYLILAYLKSGKDELAVRQMKEVLKLSPKDITLLFQLARLEEKRGRIKEAVRVYGKILAISPGHKKAGEEHLRLLLNLARLQEKQGKYSEALETYKQILEISPDNEDIEEAYLRLRLKGLPHEGKE